MNWDKYNISFITAIEFINNLCKASRLLFNFNVVFESEFSNGIDRVPFPVSFQ